MNLSIDKTFLKDVYYLFYPNLCVTCEKILLQNEKIICTRCRHDLPLFDFTDFKNNKVVSALYGRVPIEKGISLLYFTKQSKTQKLIHQLKYKGSQQIGTFLGDWLGARLKKSKEFDNIDYIIPVPLHPKKRKKRGYNQLTNFGKRLSEILDIPYNTDLLKRISSTKTQTFKSRFERFGNQNTKFKNSDIQFFKDKNVLLIDDVITTGATLQACCKELLKTQNISISIATMACAV